MNITLEKGHSHITLDLDDQHIAGVLQGRDIPALGHDAVARIIGDGIRSHAPGDIRDKQIAVIIPDDTRLWARGDLFVPVIINTLTDMGADPGCITVIIALGTHRKIPASGFAALCGKGIPDKVRVINSAGLAPGRLDHIGTTPSGTPLDITREAREADHIIIFGGILHHMLAGYGGGRKYILPGIAGEASIQANHSLAIDGKGIPLPTVTQAICRDNPVSRDMADGADMFLKGKTCTYAAVAANGRGEIFHAQAGGLHTVFEKGCRELDRACCVDVDRPGDFVLFSAGGHRTDAQLYQATKALFNAVNVARIGAPLLFVAGCGQGPGNDRFADALKTYKTDPGRLGRKLTTEFHMPDYVALRVMDILNRYRVTLVSDLDPADVRDMGFGHTRDPQEWAGRLKGRGYVIPFAENILPRVVSPAS